jgi:N-acetylglucosaminyldiphosphoundecaprenol N-acetyl-beta-D-mannosaminyltransferase
MQTTTTPAPTAPALRADDISSSDEVLILDRRTSGRFVSFLGLDFAPMDSKTLLARTIEAAGRKDEFRYLITPNVDGMVRFHAQPENRSLFEDAWVSVNDSRILELLAGWSGLTIPACPGSDLTGSVLETAIDPAEPVVVIGCSQEVIDAIKSRYGLTDVRWHQPPMGLRNNPEAIAAAAQFCVQNPARFTLLCVGDPQQVMVARAIKLTGQATGVGLCVGASLEFLAGMRQRAPRWMQQTRLEWLFRLISEPKVLWKRYLVEGPKIFSIWWQWRKQTK